LLDLEANMDRTFAALCLCVALLMPRLAAAQAPPSEALVAARELVATLRTADQMKAILPAILQSMKPAIVQNRPQVEQDYDVIAPILLEGMSLGLAELTDQIAAIYANNFTAAEMKELAAFYRGPIGQKFLDKTPAVMQQTMAAGQQFGGRIAAELQARMIEELRKRGNKL
jgi:hypothetical protein